MIGMFVRTNCKFCRFNQNILFFTLDSFQCLCFLQDDFCFERRDWDTVQPNELPEGSRLVSTSSTGLH